MCAAGRRFAGSSGALFRGAKLPKSAESQRTSAHLSDDRQTIGASTRNSPRQPPSCTRITLRYGTLNNYSFPMQHPRLQHLQPLPATARRCIARPSQRPAPTHPPPTLYPPPRATTDKRVCSLLQLANQLSYGGRELVECHGSVLYEPRVRLVRDSCSRCMGVH